MEAIGEVLARAAIVGTGATLTLDAWAILRRLAFGTPLPDYALVGRWIAYLGRGRFRHDRIAASAPIRGEHWIGWTAHYLIGIGFAAILLAAWGIDWARRPTLAPALLVGIASIAAPFLLMQPGMGAGIAASRTARPAAARVQSLVTHAVFGFGLYLAALAANLAI